MRRRTFASPMCAHRCEPCFIQCGVAASFVAHFRRKAEAMLTFQPEPWEPEYADWAARFEEIVGRLQRAQREFQATRGVERFREPIWSELQIARLPERRVLH